MQLWLLTSDTPHQQRCGPRSSCDQAPALPCTGAQREACPLCPGTNFCWHWPTCQTWSNPITGLYPSKPQSRSSPACPAPVGKHVHQYPRSMLTNTDLTADTAVALWQTQLQPHLATVWGQSCLPKDPFTDLSSALSQTHRDMLIWTRVYKDASNIISSKTFKSCTLNHKTPPSLPLRSLKRLIHLASHHHTQVDIKSKLCPRNNSKKMYSGHSGGGAKMAEKLQTKMAAGHRSLAR